jgi:hypothetical protein
VPVVGPREPCPCGSGRRYKNCHGAGRSATSQANLRPFAGLPGEPDWVALREIVPSATARLTLAPGVGGDAARSVLLGTVLPLGWPALVRADASVVLAVQTATRSGDLGRDLAQALLVALDAEPGQGLPDLREPGMGPRLPDVLAPEPLTLTVHQGFDWWVEGPGTNAASGDAARALEQANAAVVPTTRLTGVEAAYWCRIGDRTHLRWVLPEDEDPLVDAMARLRASGELDLLDGARYIGSFRAHGLLMPVWDLPADATAEDVEAPAVRLRSRLDEALADTSPLDDAARRARGGVIGRQLTLR